MTSTTTISKRRSKITAAALGIFRSGPLWPRCRRSLKGHRALFGLCLIAAAKLGNRGGQEGGLGQKSQKGLWRIRVGVTPHSYRGVIGASREAGYLRRRVSMREE